MKCRLSHLSEIAVMTPGFAFKSKEFGGGNSRVIKIGDISKGIVASDLPTVSVTNYDISQLKKYECKQGDYLVAMTGNTIGKTGRMINGTAYANQRVLKVTAIDAVDPGFLWAVLSSSQFQRHILSHIDSHSAQPNISAKSIGQFEVLLPEPTIQKQIATLLMSIEHKIESNNRTNDYLEQCLLAKFDDMFGDNESIDGTIADIGNVVGGATPSKKIPEYYCQNGIGWITPRDLSNTTDKFISHGADDITEAGFSSCSAKKLPAGTVLFSSRAPIGYIAIAADEVTTNQGFKSIVPRQEVGTAFVYCFLVRNKARIADAGSGTTFPEVSGKAMAGIGLSLPDSSLCAEFSEWATPILDQQRCLENENRRLGELRDALLPKLMSGEIDVSRIELPE